VKTETLASKQGCKASSDSTHDVMMTLALHLRVCGALFP